jgi:glycosyltransferase involved in cell wall biosynthesis
MSLSIVIPAHNEALSIRETLHSICESEFPDRPNTELVIVGSACTDDTLKIARSYMSDRGNDLASTTMESPRGQCVALNVGIAAANGANVICVDADVTCDPNTLPLMESLLGNESLRLVGALILPDLTKLPQDRHKRLLSEVIVSDAMRRRAVGVRKSVQAGCMGFQAEDKIKFPETNTPADVWISAYTANRYGLDSIEILMDPNTYYTPPQTWDDYLAMHARYAVAHELLKIEYPELFYTVAEVTQYIDKHRSAVEIDKHWAENCQNAGVDLKAYHPLHRELKRIIKAKAPRTLQDIIANNGVWAPLDSTRIANTKLL